MAEAANYARISSIDRVNTMQIPEARTIPLGSQFPRPMAPASRDNPRNLEALLAGHSTIRGNSGDNTMHSSRTSSSGTPSILQPKTGHLRLPKFSQSVQEQPHSLLPVTLSVKGKKPSSLHPGVQYQPPTARDKASRTIFNMAGGKYNDGIEYSQNSQVPMGFILPAPQIRDDKYPNRAQGFGGGSQRPVPSVPALKPVFSGRDNHGQDSPTSHEGQLVLSHSGTTRTKTGNRFSATNNSVSAQDKDVIVILDTPSPKSTNIRIEGLTSRDYARHPSSPVLSPGAEYEDARLSSAKVFPVHSKDTTRHFSSPVNPGTPIKSLINQREVKSAEPKKIRSETLDRRSAKQGHSITREKKQKRATDTGGTEVSAKVKGLSTPKRNTSVPTNDNQGDVKINNIAQDQETRSNSVNAKQDDKTNHLQKVNTKRTEPSNEAYITVSDGHNKRPKINNNPITSSVHASPYTSFLRQYRPSNPNSSTSSGVTQESAEDKVVETKFVGGGHIGEKIGSKKSGNEEASDESETGSQFVDQNSTHENPVSTKSIIEETLSEDSAGDKLMTEAPIMEDAINMETSGNKIASDKPADNKLLPTNNNKSKSLYRPFSMR